MSPEATRIKNALVVFAVLFALLTLASLAGHIAGTSHARSSEISISFGRQDSLGTNHRARTFTPDGKVLLVAEGSRLRAWMTQACFDENALEEYREREKAAGRPDAEIMGTDEAGPWLNQDRTELRQVEQGSTEPSKLRVQSGQIEALDVRRKISGPDVTEKYDLLLLTGTEARIYRIGLQEIGNTTFPLRDIRGVSPETVRGEPTFAWRWFAPSAEDGRTKRGIDVSATADAGDPEWLRFVPGTDDFVVFYAKGHVRQFRIDLTNGTAEPLGRSIPLHRGTAISDAAFSVDGSVLATVSATEEIGENEGGFIRVLDLETGAQNVIAGMVPHTYDSVAVDATGTTVAAGRSDGRIDILRRDESGWTPGKTLPGRDALQGLAFAPSTPDRLIAIGEQRSFIFWDLQDGRVDHKLQTESRPPVPSANRVGRFFQAFGRALRRGGPILAWRTFGDEATGPGDDLIAIDEAGTVIIWNLAE